MKVDEVVGMQIQKVENGYVITTVDSDSNEKLHVATATYQIWDTVKELMGEKQ